MHRRLRYVNPNSNADTTTTTLGIVFVFSVLGLVAFILVMVTRSDIVEVDNRVDLHMSALIHDTRLNDTGVVPGIYIMPILTIDAKGRITSAIEQTPSNTGTVSFILNKTDNVDVYVDGAAGSDLNTGYSAVQARSTLDGALGAFTQFQATTCTLWVTTYLDLGTDPTVSLFPVLENHCDSFTLRGVRTNTLQDTVSGLYEAIEPNGRQWWRLFGDSGGYGSNTYMCRFMQDLNTSTTFVIETHNDTAIDYLGPQLPTGNTFQLYNISSEIRWQGEFTFQPSLPVRVEDLLFVPPDTSSYMVMDGPEQTLFKGCELGMQPIAGPSPYTEAEWTGLPGPYSGKEWATEGVYFSALAGTNFGTRHCADMSNTKIAGRIHEALVECECTWRYVHFLDGPGSFRVNQGRYYSRISAYNVRVEGVFFAYNAELYLSSFDTGSLETFDVQIFMAGRNTFGSFDLSTSSSFVLSNLAEFRVKGTFSVNGNSHATIGWGSPGPPAIYLSAYKIRVLYGSKLLIVSRSFIRDGGTGTFVDVFQGSELHINGIGSGGTVDVYSTSAGLPVYNIDKGSSAYGAGTTSNSMFAGDVIQCGTNNVTDWSVPETDLSTGCFCL